MAASKIIKNVRVVRVEFGRVSAAGNPRATVVLNNGGVYRTEDDASINYGIDNSEYKEQDHDAEIRGGRLVYLKPSKK